MLTKPDDGPEQNISVQVKYFFFLSQECNVESHLCVTTDEFLYDTAFCISLESPFFPLKQLAVILLSLTGLYSEVLVKHKPVKTTMKVLRHVAGAYAISF